MLLHLMQMEDKFERELLEAQLENDHKSRVFAVDPRRYFEYYPVEETPDQEIGEIVEVDPEDEREVQLLINQMKRAGMKFAE
jgi:hypothetical protein